MDTPILLLAVALIIGVVAALRFGRDRLRGRAVPDALRPGRPLPDFQTVDEDGTAVRSTELRGSPAVVLFVRGNWCPFCSRQVANLTARYKEITDLGARLILVTPKPLQTTRRVADIFDVDFEFWLDDGLRIARDLGLFLPAGVPGKYREDYGADTLWPTALVVDADGVIRYSAVSRFIADRPNAVTLVGALRKL